MKGLDPDESEQLYEKNKAMYEEVFRRPLLPPDAGSKNIDDMTYQEVVDVVRDQTFSLKTEQDIFPNMSASHKSLLRNYPSAAETEEDFAYLNYLERMKKQFEWYSQMSSHAWQVVPDQEVKLKKIPMDPGTRAALTFFLAALFCVTGLIAWTIYVIF